MSQNLIVKYFKGSTSSSEYQKILDIHIRKGAKTWLKNLSFGVENGQEQYAVFKLEYNDIEIDNIQFASGYIFDQSFNLGEFELEAGTNLKLYVKSDGTNTINYNGAAILIEK